MFVPQATVARGVLDLGHSQSGPASGLNQAPGAGGLPRLLHAALCTSAPFQNSGRPFPSAAGARASCPADG